MARRYTYLGDRTTDPALKGATCSAVLLPDGKCIRGRNGSMLVEFEGGRVANVIGRLLRKISPEMEKIAANGSKRAKSEFKIAKNVSKVVN